MQRRLAAILAVDVAGYSKLMGADEEGTHDRLMAYRRELLDPMICEHRGRMVKNTGDGALIEFSSVVDAVRYAVEVQRGTIGRNACLPHDQRIEFRIGINLGDVIVEPDDIYGDGVNVAARLEALAEPGGICLSRSAYDQVRGKIPIAVRDLGEQHLKNIAEAVRVFAILPDAGTQTAVGSGSAGLATSTPRLSIVVLPFINLSGDKEHEYFVDGVTEDLTTELSRHRGAFVIARNTAFSFKGKSADIRQIGRELGVRYVLEGSIRKDGQRVRVAAGLSDAESGAHLWVDRFDRDISDLLELQDAITFELARVLGVQLVEAESRRSQRSSDPDALDMLMRARAVVNRGWSRENIDAAISLCEQALQLDPDNVPALSSLARALVAKVTSLWSQAPDDDLRRAESLATQALALDPHYEQCHKAMGNLRRQQERFDEAISYYDAAIRLNPNMHSAHAGLGWSKALSGRSEEAVLHFMASIRLSPRDPFLFFQYFGIGWTGFLLGDDDRALEMLSKTIALNPKYWLAHLCLTAVYGVQDRVDDAREAYANYLRICPTARTIAQVRSMRPSTHPAYVAQLERLYAGLRKAGMPEE
jgi:TolB-like protein/class 3 adenylate cyclase/Flp pilus assembly protein TadD